MVTYVKEHSRSATDERRREIIENARKIVAHHGMEALTTEALAKAVGVTGGAIYRHFESKREILFALIDDIENSLFERVQRATNVDRSSLENLEAMMDAHLSHAERRRGVPFMVITDVLRSDDRQLRLRMQKVIERYLATIEQIIAQGIARGEIRPGVDPAAAALALFGLIQGAITLWRLADEGQRPSERRHILWETYRDGIVR